MEGEKTRYFATNSLRNPFRDIELYALPVGIAVAAWVMAVIVNATCSHDVCEAAEDGLVNVYLFVLFGLCVVMWRQIKGQ